MNKTKRVTVRLNDDEHQTLEKIAQEKREKTGFTVSTSDVIRAAISEYVQKHTNGDERKQ